MGCSNKREEKSACIGGGVAGNLWQVRSESKRRAPGLWPSAVPRHTSLALGRAQGRRMELAVERLCGACGARFQGSTAVREAADSVMARAVEAENLGHSSSWLFSWPAEVLTRRVSQSSRLFQSIRGMIPALSKTGRWPFLASTVNTLDAPSAGLFLLPTLTLHRRAHPPMPPMTSAVPVSPSEAGQPSARPADL